jgi:hypothetical protein
MVSDAVLVGLWFCVGENEQFAQKIVNLVIEGAAG